MAGLFDFLFRRETQLCEFELNIIDTVAERLDRDSSVKLNAQVQAVNKVQRLSNGKEVNLYTSRRGKAQFDNYLRFPNSRKEALLARVVVGGSGKNRLSVELWMANGRLFSLLFNKPPKLFFNTVDLRGIQANILDVLVFPEVLSANSIPGEIFNGANLFGWVQNLFEAGKLKPYRQALNKVEREKLLQAMNAGFPAEYLDLVKQMEGGEFGACSIHGLREVRKLVLPTESYYLLAEVQGRAAVGVKEGEHTGGLYLLAADSAEAEELNESFHEALQTLIALPV